jgi:hypothetical protein
LSNDAVEVGIGRTRNVEITLANIVNSFVVEHEGNVGVLEKCVSGEDGVVRLYDRGSDLRRGIDAKVELGLLGVILA